MLNKYYKMKKHNVIPISNWIIPFTIFICAIDQSFSQNPQKRFLCEKNKGVAVPSLPQAFSTNIRLNFGMELHTREVVSCVNKMEKKELIEFKTADRRVKYIKRGDLNTLLVITYQKDAHPTCDVSKMSAGSSLLEPKDVGPSEIILKTTQAMKLRNKFTPVAGKMENDVLVQKWEACLTDPDPEINVAVSFSAPYWKPSHVSSLHPNASYIVQIEAQIDKVFMTAQYSNFDPSVPDDAVFQPPEDVYCDGFRSDKLPPSMGDSFSYDVEIITYINSEGISPVVSSRKVYYDYESKISRIDFYDPLFETPDMFSPITAQQKSVIHDFNAGIQYNFNPFTGKCTLASLKSTFSVISDTTKSDIMLTGKEYFWMDGAKFSYNGQFPVRGVMADVFTAIITDSETKNTSLVTWYFATEETRVVETENVEKNVLLRMTVRPETSEGKEGLVLINFYNFARGVPNVDKYDLTNCYNASYSKFLVLTFTSNDLLHGSEKLVGLLVHSALKNATGISKQRIIIKQVIFIGKYMYAEFDILDAPYGTDSKTSKEISLDEAIRYLENSVSSGSFNVRISVGNDIIVLRPEPNGLNIFAGDRHRIPSVIGYNEGSVISLTIGMLILGFLLGFVTLNLVMSRKFGVSLFQKSNANVPYSNSLNESSM